MSMHTPGPWKTFDFAGTIGVVGPKSDIAYTQSAPHLVAAGMMAPGIDRQREENLANARLIAAAPELLDALQGLMTSDNSANGTHAWQVALVALAKARGES